MPKLSKADVQEIRESTEPKGVLAERYGVRADYAEKVRTGKRRNPVDVYTGRREIPVQYAHPIQQKAKPGQPSRLDWPSNRCGVCGELHQHQTNGDGDVLESCSCGMWRLHKTRPNVRT